MARDWKGTQMSINSEVEKKEMWYIYRIEFHTAIEKNNGWCMHQRGWKPDAQEYIHTYMYILAVHLCNVPRSGKIIDGSGSQSGKRSLSEQVLTGEKHMETLQGDGHVLLLYLDGGYRDMCMCGKFIELYTLGNGTYLCFALCILKNILL